MWTMMKWEAVPHLFLLRPLLEHLRPHLHLVVVVVAPDPRRLLALVPDPRLDGLLLRLTRLHLTLTTHDTTGVEVTQTLVVSRTT